MKKKIAILGSTGSIGKSTLEVIKKDKKNFDIILLTANNNYKKLIQQARFYNPRNILISNIQHYSKVKKKLKNKRIKIFTGNIPINKIIKSKLDYTMSAIVGFAGLQPTIDAIKVSKVVAIANKESIICGWDILYKLIKKYNTKLLPVDSEHFSIMELTKNLKDSDVKEIIITASGGPFLKKSLNRLNKVKPKEATNHPNWKMGKKISIDSSTLMNKVFEVIEAKKIFNLNLNKIEILINPNSYLHAIVEFNDGIIKMLVHETKMDIPIYNSIFDVSSNIKYNTKDLDIKKINKLSLMKPNSKKFSTLNILNLIPDKDSLFETVLITANDVLVDMFLNKKIEFNQISFYLIKIIKFNLFKKYYKMSPKSIKQIMKVKNLTKNFINQYLKNKIK